jgi:hypothetical protein
MQKRAEESAMRCRQNVFPVVKHFMTETDEKKSAKLRICKTILK